MQPSPHGSIQMSAMVPRNQLLLALIQKEYPSYHPLLAIARIAHNEAASLGLQFDCHKTIAKYVEPELKSIEVRGSVESQHRVRVSLFDPIEGEYTSVEQIARDVVEDSIMSQDGEFVGAQVVGGNW